MQTKYDAEIPQLIKLLNKQCFESLVEHGMIYYDENQDLKLSWDIKDNGRPVHPVAMLFENLGFNACSDGIRAGNDDTIIDKAIEYSLKSYELDPTSPDNVGNLVQCFMECKKDYEEALKWAKIYVELIEVNGYLNRNKAVYKDYCEILLQLNRFEEALEFYDRHEKTMQKIYNHKKLKVKILKALKDYDKALEEMAIIISQLREKDDLYLSSFYPDVFCLRGQIYIEKGDIELGFADFNDIKSRYLYLLQNEDMDMIKILRDYADFFAKEGDMEKSKLLQGLAEKLKEDIKQHLKGKIQKFTELLDQARTNDYKFRVHCKTKQL